MSPRAGLAELVGTTYLVQYIGCWLPNQRNCCRRYNVLLQADMVRPTLLLYNYSTTRISLAFCVVCVWNMCDETIFVQRTAHDSAIFRECSDNTATSKRMNMIVDDMREETHKKPTKQNKRNFQP